MDKMIQSLPVDWFSEFEPGVSLDARVVTARKMPHQTHRNLEGSLAETSRSLEDEGQRVKPF